MARRNDDAYYRAFEAAAHDQLDEYFAAHRKRGPRATKSQATFVRTCRVEYVGGRPPSPFMIIGFPHTLWGVLPSDDHERVALLAQAGRALLPHIDHHVDRCVG